MPNSADKTQLDALEEDDSDVIDLTEEVGGDASAPPAAAVDDLGLDIPEFRVPTRADAPDEDEDDHLALDPEDIGPGDGSVSDALPPEPTSEADDDGIVDLTEASYPDDDEGELDRDDLVQTVQMEAFDRAKIELTDAARNWSADTLLLDQRYAPDALIVPPRVLTRKWKDGAEEGGAARPTSRRGMSEQDRRALATTVKTVASDDAQPEVEPDPIELDSEALEETEAVKPPPKPSPPPRRTPPPGAAPQPQQQGKTQQQPGRRPQPTPMLQNGGPGFGGAAPSPARGADDDLSGIVQELLEEKKARPMRAEKPADARRANWCVDTFTEEYLRTLPKNLHAQTERDVTFILKSLGVRKGGRILDLACGFGRHSIELAKRNFEVAGLDLSLPLLQRALGEAQRRSLSIKFIHGDMRELNFAAIFDACFSWQTSFGFFDDRTNMRVLKGVHRALKPGGRFLVDVVNRDYVVAEMPSRTWWEGVDCVFLEEVEFDHHSSTLHTKRSFIYEDGSPPQEFSSYIRLYSLHEMRRIMEAAGFEVLEISGELHHRGNYLGPTSSRLIVLAEKTIE